MDMAYRKKSLTIGYADFETTNHLDIEHETGFRCERVGTEVHMVDRDGNDHGIPTVKVKCAGLLVRFPDGSRNGCVVDSLDEFFEKLLEWKVDRCYFHNLKFDDSFIGSYLKDDWTAMVGGWNIRSKSRLMSDMGVVYSDVLEFKGKKDPVSHRPGKHKCELWDSHKIWSNQLRVIGKDFGVNKGGYEEPLRVGCDLRMKAYCLQDCHVMMTAMEYYFDMCKGLTHGKRPHGWMTAASTAYNLCMEWARDRWGGKITDSMYPACTEENGFPVWLREGYKGATPLLDEDIRGKVLEDVKVFDVNSMYPDKLKNNRLPGGKPIVVEPSMEVLEKEAERGRIWFAKVRMCADVKEGHRPTYMLKRADPDGNIACPHIRDHEWGTYQVISSIDMELLERDYENIHIEVEEAIVFNSHVGFISGFIEHWYSIKEEASIKGEKALKAFAKLILNSLYGKFGANPEHRGAHYEYEGDIIRVKDDLEVEVDKKPLYLPLAACTTAWARNMISITVNSIGFEHVAYTDTDSVHVHGLDNDDCFERIEGAGFEIHGSKLGAWDYESRWKEAVYVRNKGYFHFGKMDKHTGAYIGGNEIKMAGANGFEGMDSVEDVVGKELYGTQLGGCRVNGGTLLLDKEVQIDLRVDACLKTRERVPGMSTSAGMIEMARRKNDVFASFGVFRWE